jgi:hypothetical protein
LRTTTTVISLAATTIRPTIIIIRAAASSGPPTVGIASAIIAIGTAIIIGTGGTIGTIIE